jgi:hypothetical protein
MAGLGAIRGIEDRADVRSDPDAQRRRWHVLRGILLQMKLAALPRHTWKYSLTCRRQATINRGLA